MSEFITKDGALIKAKNVSGNVVIPNDITKITQDSYNMRGAFEECIDLISVEIPDSVTKIDGSAFANCTNLTSVSIPDSVKYMGNGVFRNCINLTDIEIPNSVTSIGADTFYNCTNLTNITIPSSVVTIGANAFKKCTGLTEITIPENIKKLGSEFLGTVEIGIFADCTNLKKVIWNSPIKLTGKLIENMFNGCDKLESISYHGKSIILNLETDEFIIKNGVLIKAKNVDGNVIIPDGVISIGDSAFEGCEHLTGVEMPEGIISIGNCAFQGCSNLIDIKISDSVTNIGHYVFEDCASLISVKIPNSVINIGECIFVNCENLSNINIINAVEFEKGHWEATYDYVTEPMIFCSSCPNLKEITWESSVRPTIELINSIIVDCPNVEKLIYNEQEIDLCKHKKLEKVIDLYKSLPIEEKELNLDNLIKSLNEAR